MFYIYKITNLINHKIYIGKTCRDIKTRWNEHCSQAYNHNDNFHLHNAIAKYGKENFTIEEIDNTTDITTLNQLEQFYIKKYDTTNQQLGYNLTVGGDGNRKYDWEEIRALWDQGYAVKEIINYLHCDKGTVGQALKNYSTYTYQLSLRRSNARSKPINQYNLNRQLICTFPSVAEAARSINCNEMSIFNCLHNSHYALGYFWTYQDESLPNNVHANTSTKKRKIKQYDLNHNLLRTFMSAADAARTVHPNSNINSSSSSILQVCKGNRRTAYGYIWEYDNENMGEDI